MRTMRRSLSPTYALPDEVRTMLVRRLTELAGLSLIGLVSLCGIALATWSVQDPSFNHATSGVVHNWLGSNGAATADLMMQLFGVGAVAALLPLAFWGWR